MATTTSTFGEPKDTYKAAKTSTAGATVASEPSAAGQEGQRGSEPTVTPTRMRPTVKYISL